MFFRLDNISKDFPKLSGLGKDHSDLLNDLNKLAEKKIEKEKFLDIVNESNDCKDSLCAICRSLYEEKEGKPLDLIANGFRTQITICKTIEESKTYTCPNPIKKMKIAVCDRHKKYNILLFKKPATQEAKKALGQLLGALIEERAFEDFCIEKLSKSAVPGTEDIFDPSKITKLLEALLEKDSRYGPKFGNLIKDYMKKNWKGIKSPSEILTLLQETINGSSSEGGAGVTNLLKYCLKCYKASDGSLLHLGCGHDLCKVCIETQKKYMEPGLPLVLVCPLNSCKYVLNRAEQVIFGVPQVKTKGIMVFIY